MKKPPKHVTLDGLKIPIQYREKIVYNEAGLIEAGCYQYNRRRIRYQHGLPVSADRDTILHELLHACIDRTGLPVGREEEKYVTMLTPWLLAALRDNPKLVAFLTQP